MSGEGWRDRATNIGRIRDKKDIKVYGGRSFTLKAMLPGKRVKKVIFKAVFEENYGGFCSIRTINRELFYNKRYMFSGSETKKFFMIKNALKIEYACLIRIRKSTGVPNSRNI